MAGRALSRMLWHLERLVLRRERVGTDPMGNTYFRAFEQGRTGKIEERRWVALRSGRGPDQYDPESVPPEWSRWLSRTRAEPPSEADLARYQAQRAELAMRVAALEAEEAKRKLRLEAAGGGQAAGPAPDMGRFLDQLTGKGYGQDSSVVADGAGRDGGGGSAGGGGQQGGSSTEPSGKGGSYQPGAWTPPGG